MKLIRWIPRIGAQISAQIVLGVVLVAGCNSWHGSAGLPGLDKWRDEQGIIKRAKNDPFPTPEQVGIK